MFQVRCRLVSLEVAERAIVDMWRQVEELGARSPVLTCRFPMSGLVDLTFEWNVRIDGGESQSGDAARAITRRRVPGLRMRSYASPAPRRARNAARISARA